MQVCFQIVYKDDAVRPHRLTCLEMRMKNTHSAQNICEKHDDTALAVAQHLKRNLHNSEITQLPLDFF